MAIFKIILLLLALKSALFWVYILQLKEYRFDRFWAEYGRAKTILKFLILGGAKKIYAPVWTAKTTLIFLTASVFMISLFSLEIFNSFGLPAYILIYLLAPLFVISSVIIINAPVYIAKRHIFNLARTKISLAKNLTVIGITGSYGKSSTKEFLSQLLSQKFKVVKTSGNINTEIGVARFILSDLKPEDEILIVEMGAYKIGEIKKLCEITRPKIGILTGISEQHLALFGSLDAVKNAKYELIESLPPDGLAVFNGENKYCLELSEKWKGDKIIYPPIFSRRKRWEGVGGYLNDSKLRPDLPPHYRLNLSGAVVTAKYLGMTDEEISRAAAEIRPVGRMMKTFIGKNNLLIIDDSYSANPEGVYAALDYLFFQPRENKIVVMPCLIELGRAAAGIHKKIGQAINKNCDFAIITTPAYFKEIKSEAGDKAILESSPKKVIELLGAKADSETAILLEGRLSEDIVKSLNETF